jgi:hypothetical protein
MHNAQKDWIGSIAIAALGAGVITTFAVSRKIRFGYYSFRGDCCGIVRSFALKINPSTQVDGEAAC